MRPGTLARMVVILALLLLIFVGTAIRAYDLQIASAGVHLSRRDWQHTARVEVASPRGTIVDREGREFARSVTKFDLVLDARFLMRNELQHRDWLARELAQAGHLDADRFQQLTSGPVERLPQSTTLRRRVDGDEAEAFLSRLQQRGISAIYLTPSYQREYPNGTLAGHTIGAVRLDDQKGVSGVELGWDSQLAGRPLRYELIRDRSRRAFLRGEVPDPRVAEGNTLRLTLDMGIQRIVEEVLRDTITSHEAERGTAIVTRASTGEILAMASWPEFNPADYQAYPQEAWQNPAVAHAWEPGSTAKIATFAAAFERGLIGADDPIDCQIGLINIDGKWIHDTKKRGVIPMWEAFQISSNVASIKVGLGIDAPSFREQLVRFGFGRPTGIGLPGENAGLLRRAPWLRIEHANIAFGQGFSVTPLQLHMHTSVIANRGILMKPRLLREVVDGLGRVVQVLLPEARERAIGEAAAAHMTHLMSTVTQKGGTGTRAAVPGFTVAGKTGTAQLWSPDTRAYEDAWIASFSGFVPAESPEIVITVMIHRPNKKIAYFGGAVAGPAFARIASQTLPLLGIFPSATATAPNAVGAASAEDTSPLGASAEATHAVGIDGASGGPLGVGADAYDATTRNDAAVVRVPDLGGLWVADAFERAREARVPIRVQGTGRVVRQAPVAGTAVVPGTVVELILESAAGGQADAPL